MPVTAAPGDAIQTDVAPTAPPVVPLLGLRIHRVRSDEALAWALHLAAGATPSLVMTPNTDHVLRAHRDPAFRALYDAADFVIADGQPVVWASRILGQPLPERVAGSDLMPALCVAAARRGLTYYFVGGNPGDAQAAAAVLAARAGRDGCVGVDCPPLGFEKDSAYVDALLARIAAARPAIVCLGLGSPKQERLMVEWRQRIPRGVILGVGITFSFVAGTVRRAPRWLQRLGLEWFWRLSREPRRLWRRYLDNLVAFPWLVLRHRLRHQPIANGSPARGPGPR